jgi:hypothetical protein
MRVDRCKSFGKPGIMKKAKQADARKWKKMMKVNDDAIN